MLYAVTESSLISSLPLSISPSLFCHSLSPSLSLDCSLSSWIATKVWTKREFQGWEGGLLSYKKWEKIIMNKQTYASYAFSVCYCPDMTRLLVFSIFDMDALQNTRLKVILSRPTIVIIHLIKGRFTKNTYVYDMLTRTDSGLLTTWFGFIWRAAELKTSVLCY